MIHHIAVLAAAAFGALIGNLIVWMVISAFYRHKNR